MIFYVLLTYGPQPVGNIWQHPATQSQFQALKRFQKRIIGSCPSVSASETRGCYDYARSVKNLASLPMLTKITSMCQQRDAGQVLIDDLARVFARCPADKREMLLAQMEAVGRHVLSVAHGKTLEKFSDAEKAFLIANPEAHLKMFMNVTRKWRRNDAARSAQTENARYSSLQSRRQRSSKIGQLIRDVERDVLAEKGRASFSMVAEEANRRGLTTATGKAWNRQNVARVLSSDTRDAASDDVEEGVSQT